MTKRKLTGAEHPIGQAVVKLTEFYYSEWGAAKGVKWEQITNMPFEPKSFSILVNRLITAEDADLRRRIMEVLK